jgi:hypothetical protein
VAGAVVKPYVSGDVYNAAQEAVQKIEQPPKK